MITRKKTPAVRDGIVQGGHLNMEERMRTRRGLGIALFCAVMVTIGFAPTVGAADKKEATGTWKWKTPGRGGAEGREVTLKLKQDGDKLTGKILGSGNNQDTEISDGKVKGDELSFNVVRKTRSGQERTTKYHGKLDGDTIKGKSETEGRNGQTRETDWEAKRAKDKN